MEEQDKYKRTLQRRVGSRVKQARTLRKLSQEELAGRAGIGNRYLGQIERAEAKVTVDNLAAVAHHLSMEVSELLAPPPGTAHDTSFYLVAEEDLDVIDQGLRTLQTVLERIARVKRAASRRRRASAK